MVSFSVLVLSSRGIRTFRKFRKMNFTPLLKNNDTVRTFVDELLIRTAIGGSVNVQAMEKSTSLNTKGDVLVGDPKFIQNRVIALSADIANKWKEKYDKKQWRKNIYNLATNLL